MKVVTNEVRFSYMNVMSPRVDKTSGKEKYSVTVLLPKSDLVTKAAIDRAIAEAIEAGKKGIWNGLVPPLVATPIHDGDGVRPSGEAFGPECKGCWVFTASTSADPKFPKPGVLDAAGYPIMNASEVYSGMYGRVSINFGPYMNTGKKGISCYLNHLQKFRDGEPLAGTRSTAEEDFGVASQQAAPQYQAPQQTVYQQPVQQYQAPQQPVYQQPVPQYQSPQQPQQLDPITGQPIVAGVMGI